MQSTLQTIREEFAIKLVTAIATKSPEALACLLLSYEEQIYLAGNEMEITISEQDYNKGIYDQCDGFLKNANTFIDKKSVLRTSKVALSNIAKIDTYEFRESDEKFQEIRNISILMKKSYKADKAHTIGFEIKDTLYIRQKIKMSTVHSVRYYESSKYANIPYTKIENKEILKKVVQENIAYRYWQSFYHFDDWYMHEGDLVVDELRAKVNLIIKGNLIIKEPLVEIDHELIVLGSTVVNAILLVDVNNVCFSGGIEFKVGLFSLGTGSIRLLNKTIGPILFNDSESTFVENAQQTLCFVDYSMEHLSHGDLNMLVLNEFIQENETAEYYIDVERILSAIRLKKTVLK